MALIKTIDTAYELKKEFISYDRDNFSMKACEAIVTYFDEIEKNVELDIIGICCNFNETDYDTLKDEYELETKDEVLEYLEDRTYAVDLDDTVLYVVY